MNLKKILDVTIVALALLTAVNVEAKGRKSQDVSFPYDASLAGVRLTSGRYHVQWETHSPDATVTFQLDNKVVATAEGRVEERGKEFSRSAVVYDRGVDGSQVVREIRFAGSSEVIVFGVSH